MCEFITAENNSAKNNYSEICLELDHKQKECDKLKIERDRKDSTNSSFFSMNNYFRF